MPVQEAADEQRGERRDTTTDLPRVLTAESRASQSSRTELLRLMLLARSLEGRVLAIRNGAAAGHRRRARGRGSEALVGAAAVLGPEDRLFAPDRYLSAHLARGLPPETFLLRCLGSRGEAPEADAWTVGYASPGSELIDMAAGAALALQLRGADGVAMAIVPGECYVTGHAAEALRAARPRKLPLVVVVEASPTVELADRPDDEVDLSDVEAIGAAARKSVEDARHGDGPGLLLCAASRQAAGGPLVNGAPIADPIERELKRMAVNATTRELLRPLRREVRAEVRDAMRRARSLDAYWRRQGISTA